MTSAPRAAALPARRIALVWLASCALVFLFAFPNVAGRRFPDPDDVLRLVQVRDLLAGQGWFDLHQYRIDGPHGTLMHWSRLVDLPLALTIAALAALLGAAGGEQVALIAVPLVTLGAIVWVVARLGARFFDREGATLACLCLGLSPLLMAQVQPMRIDHHGWQIFTVMLAMVGLLPGRPLRGAVLTGFALALGLSISLEILPLAAAFGAVFALRWLADGKSGQALVTFLASLTISLAGLFLATHGLADLAQHCDAVSPAHLGLFVIVTLGAGAILALRPRSQAVLLALLGLAGATGLACYLWAAPQCAAGPFGNLDPLVREFWYDNVREGRPAWQVAFALWAPIAAHGLIALAALAYLWRRARGAERAWWFEYLVVTAAAFATGMLVWRSMAFVGALSALPLGWLGARLLGAFRDAISTGRKLALAGAMVLVLVPGFPVAVAKAVSPPGALTPDEEPAPPPGACEVAPSAAALNRLPAGTVFAPLDLGPALLDVTHHSVVATSHHRAAAAMHDVIAAFLGSPDEARQLIRKHQARYLLVCSDLVEFRLYARKSPGGLAAQLARGRVPAWLQPVAIDSASGLQVWRVAD